MSYTRIEIEDNQTVVQCNDCGAHVIDKPETEVQHYATCVPGEAERWERFYSEKD